MKRARDVEAAQAKTAEAEPAEFESTAVEPTPTRPTVYGHVKSPVKSTWIEYSPPTSNKRSRAAVSPERRRDVRVHAAAASAAARKATIARKEAEKSKRRSQPGQRPAPARAHSMTLKEATDFVKTVGNLGDKPASTQVVHDQASFEQLVEVVTELQDWYLSAYRATSLAHKAVRTMLWAAISNSTTLFQAAIFVAGTHSNTCGLPSTAVHMGAGLILLRGASLEAIQTAVVTADAESMPAVAIAMLAGWERRFGDRQSYEIHMRAWRSLALPPKALEENHVSTLTDVTLQMYRDSLNERSRSGTAGSKLDAILHLNPGFYVFQSTRPEARSLLSIVSRIVKCDPTAPDSVPHARKLALENMAWSPTHTRSCEPLPQYEEDWDQQELNALYHVRAVNIAILGFLVKASLDAHHLVWDWDVLGALHVHTVSCQHLRTEELMGTKYQEIAVWTRYILCAVARDPERDGLLRSLLRQLGIKLWEHLQTMLDSLWYSESLIGTHCRSFFDALMRSSDSPVG